MLERVGHCSLESGHVLGRDFKAVDYKFDVMIAISVDLHAEGEFAQLAVNPRREKPFLRICSKSSL